MSDRGQAAPLARRLRAAGARRAGLGGGYFAWRLTRDEAESFADPVAQFKYGSTGGDRNFGLPYVMWVAMPSLFRDLLPEGREDEGWAAFGFIYEDEADLPPELGQAAAGGHVAPQPHGDRPDLPELRRLPRRQRADRRRRPRRW